MKTTKDNPLNAHDHPRLPAAEVSPRNETACPSMRANLHRSQRTDAPATSPSGEVVPSPSPRGNAAVCGGRPDVRTNARDARKNKKSSRLAADRHPEAASPSCTRWTGLCLCPELGMKARTARKEKSTRSAQLSCRQKRRNKRQKKLQNRSRN